MYHLVRGFCPRTSVLEGFHPEVVLVPPGLRWGRAPQP